MFEHYFPDALGVLAEQRLGRYIQTWAAIPKINKLIPAYLYHKDFIVFSLLHDGREKEKREIPTV